MSAWLKRFGLHLAAAVGATGIFVAAAAVGATQTRDQPAAVPIVTVATPGLPAPTAGAPAGPATPIAGTTGGARSAATPAVSPERSLAGSIQEVLPEGGLVVLGVGGRTWSVAPAPGALLRLNGKAAKLEALQPGDKVVILGQAQARQRGQPGNRFLAHAITARRP
jgi:hypothetical protein